MALHTKKAMPQDSVEALAALKQIVSAESAMRAGDNTSGKQVSDIFAQALSGGSDITRVAVASQLESSALLHVQSGWFEEKKQFEEHAQQLSTQRLEGLCLDAGRLGQAYAAAAEVQSEEQSRKDILTSVQELQGKMQQTEALVWAIQGRSVDESHQLSRQNSSALLRSFLGGVIASNHAAGAPLVEECKGQLDQLDYEDLNRLLLRSSCEQAYLTLVDQLTSDSPKGQVEELRSLCEKATPSTLSITAESYALVKERIEAERVQHYQMEEMLRAVTQRKVVRNFCECLSSGDRKQAAAVLAQSNVFVKTERAKLSRNILQKQWRTEPEVFVELFVMAVEKERSAEPYCIFPEETLSPYDALLLYNVLGEYSPSVQFENEQIASFLHAHIRSIVETKRSVFSFYGKKRSAKKVKTLLDDMTVLRYLFDAVIAARENAADVFECVRKIGEKLTTNS